MLNWRPASRAQSRDLLGIRFKCITLHQAVVSHRWAPDNEHRIPFSRFDVQWHLFRRCRWFGGSGSDWDARYSVNNISAVLHLNAMAVVGPTGFVVAAPANFPLVEVETRANLLNGIAKEYSHYISSKRTMWKKASVQRIDHAECLLTLLTPSSTIIAEHSGPLDFLSSAHY